MSAGRSVVLGMLIAAVIRGAGAAPADGVPAVAAAPDGRTLFMRQCGVCHLPGGTGTFMLERRLGKEQALLNERANLAAPYVVTIARNGIMSMPRFTRAELTDAELAAIAAYLTRPR
jgi:mono/diheme cytochrome c family protein